MSSPLSYLFYFACVFLCVVLIVQIFGRRTSYKKIFIASVVAVFAYLVGLSILQYISWKSGPTRFLLPPYGSWSYFAGYVGVRFWAPFVVSGIIALLLNYGMRRLNERKNGALFYDNEKWIAMLCIFLAGYPGLLIYIPLFLGVFVLISAARILLTGKQTKTSSYFLWIPVALCGILLSELWLKATPFWALLKL